MKLLLVDGHYYLYRSFFAIRGLTNSRGEPTNAIYGFTKALRKMLLDLQPDLAAVVWDAGIPEYRMQLQPGYKQDREEMPQELQVQQDPLRELIPLMGVKNVFLEGMEADDLIASYAVAAQQEGMSSLIATNDKDILQVVTDQITIYSVAKPDLAAFAPEGATFTLLGPEQVTRKWGVAPTQIVDLLALTGDSADGIPGIPGVGKKTAAKWLQRYGSLEKILSGEGIDPKVIAKIKGQEETLDSNQKMIQLDCALPLPLSLTEFEITPSYPALLNRLQELEFGTLHRELKEEARWWLEK